MLICTSLCVHKFIGVRKYQMPNPMVKLEKEKTEASETIV